MFQSIRSHVAVAVLCLGAPALHGQVTWRVNVSDAGVEANDGSGNLAVSGDGRFVAFHSNASNLVPGDTNAKPDVFVHDRRTATTERISVDSLGAEGDGYSYMASISRDGRFVAFHSSSTNLVAGDTNNRGDVFVRDRWTDTTSRVSLDSAGIQGNGGSSNPSISATGRIVAFESFATNLVVGDTNGRQDIFVHDRGTGVTTRVSVASTGVQGDLSSHMGALSGDGRVVAFEGLSTTLVPGDTNGATDVFVHDLDTGLTTRVSVHSSGAQADSGSYNPVLSHDGRLVAFESLAQNLVSDDTNGERDVFLHDRVTRLTRRVSLTDAGGEADNDSSYPGLEDSGQSVVFESRATNLVAGDTNGASDVFLRDLGKPGTTRLSVDSDGLEADGNSQRVRASGDGRFVGFVSHATNLVPGDTNGVGDVFLHGPELVLEVTPAVVGLNDKLELATWRGRAGRPAMLFVVDVSGTPLVYQITSGTFDPTGLWAPSFTVPGDPALQGLDVTFLSFGPGDVHNKVGASGPELLYIR